MKLANLNERTKPFERLAKIGPDYLILALHEPPKGSGLPVITKLSMAATYEEAKTIEAQEIAAGGKHVVINEEAFCAKNNPGLIESWAASYTWHNADLEGTWTEHPDGGFCFHEIPAHAKPGYKDGEDPPPRPARNKFDRAEASVSKTNVPDDNIFDMLRGALWRAAEAEADGNDPQLVEAYESEARRLIAKARKHLDAAERELDGKPEEGATE